MSSCWARSFRTFSSSNLGLGLRNARQFRSSATLKQPRLPFLQNGRLNPWKKSSASDGSFVGQLPRPKLFRPVLFALAVGTGTYLTCACIDSIETHDWMKSLTTTSFFGDHVPSNREMHMARLKMQQVTLQTRFDRLKEQTKNWPVAVAAHFQRLYAIVANSWLLSSEGTQVAYQITTANALIFLAWRIPRVRALMNRSFMHDPVSGRAYTMLTSVFSHATLPHLFFNSMALISFAPAVFSSFFNHVQDPVGEETPSPPPRSNSTYEFIGFYIAAGLASSLLSHVVTARFRIPRLLKNLADPSKAATVAQAASMIKPSLGASGAIYAMIVLTAFTVPHSAVNIMFIPIAIPISTAVSATVCLDMIGILRGWQMFDHWAHLGGAAFGALYYWKGMDLWDNLRRDLDQEVANTTEERDSELGEESDEPHTEPQKKSG